MPVEVVANIPANVEYVQVFVDRLLFENVYPDKNTTVAWFHLYDDDTDRHLGGVQVPGGVFEDGVRPGSRGLWTWWRWRIPEGVSRLRARVEPSVTFDANIDLDIFFAGEL